MRRIVTALAFVLVAAAITAGTTAAGGSGAQKTTLLQTTDYVCQSGANPAPESESFAVLNSRNGRLMAQVVLRNAIPNATYTIWVIQTPSGADCGNPDFTMTTNDEGYASAHWEEDVIPGSTGAWVAAFHSFAPGGFLYGPGATLG